MSPRELKKKVENLEIISKPDYQELHKNKSEN